MITPSKKRFVIYLLCIFFTSELRVPGAPGNEPVAAFAWPQHGGRGQAVYLASGGGVAFIGGGCFFCRMIKLMRVPQSRAAGRARRRRGTPQSRGEPHPECRLARPERGAS